MRSGLERKRGGAMDRLRLERMEFYGYHGVFPEENRLGQRYLIDLELGMDLSAAGRSDRLEDTVNYADLYRLVKGVAEGPPFRLIEALAEKVASEILRVYTMVSEIKVRVVKPHPPVDIHFGGVSVEIVRKREDGCRTTLRE